MCWLIFGSRQYVLHIIWYVFLTLYNLRFLKSVASLSCHMLYNNRSFRWEKIVYSLSWSSHHFQEQAFFPPLCVFLIVWVKNSERWQTEKWPEEKAAQNSWRKSYSKPLMAFLNYLQLVLIQAQFCFVLFCWDRVLLYSRC